MGSHHPIRKTIAPEPVVVPDKLYFRIGDVAKLCDVPAYVLRFWETEFPQLKPNKGGTGQRLYRKRDVEIALRVKSLLYEQGYTIPGARLAFKTDAPRLEAVPESTLSAAPAALPAFEAAHDPGAQREAHIGAHGEDHIGARIRRQAHHRDRLSALRAELQSLSAQLSSPVAAYPLPSSIQPTASSKPLRARLMLEPKPGFIPDPKPAIHLNQGDLFAAE